MRLDGVQRAGLLAAMVAGTGLAVALGSERVGGLVPCALCLLERWPYQTVIALGILAAVWRAAARPLVLLAALAMLASVGLAALHVGVERGAWPSPLPECAAPTLGGGTVAERLARMPEHPAKPCDDPTYLVPGLPVSMAEMNGIVSLLLAALLLASAIRRTRA